MFVGSRLYPNKEELFSAAMAMAALIASKSPIAVATTKHNMVYSRDHTVEESLNHMVWFAVIGVVSLHVYCDYYYYIRDI